MVKAFDLLGRPAAPDGDLAPGLELQPVAAHPVDAAATEPPPPEPEGPDFSPQGCLDLAARLDSLGGIALTEGEVRRLAAGATGPCVLARVRILRVAGWHSEGLGLQRSAWRLAGSRREAIALTFEAAGRDEDFLRAISDADGARDRGAWPAAEQLYARALALYPLQYGYRVQLGHMLKEQDRFLPAEIAYRDAVALGASLADVGVHLRFVCERQGKAYLPPPGSAATDERAMAQAPSSLDIEALVHLFWHDLALADEEHAALLAECATCEDVAVRLTRDRRFVRRNRTLLRMLKDRA